MKASAPSVKLRRKALAVLVAACYSSAHAAPVNPVVVAGQASFNLQGKTYTITNTPNAIINWQGFSIGADELARFVQQSSDSKVLNRITGQDPSVILGSLQSNGKVFLINPNGVLFGAGSRVDVNGLVASSLNISNADFLAGKNNFDGAAGAGKVSNQGTITTPSGGQIFLIAPAVENSGILSAPNGDVVLAAGHSVQLFDSKDPNVQVVVSSATDQALNLGRIVAQGGRIGVYGALVKQRGVINANSAVRGANGKIVLKASGATLLEAGSSTTATGSNLNTGGDILLLGDKVGVTGNAVVDASGESGGGTLLVGGDYQGRNAAVMNASQAYVGKDATLRADAVESGNGGKVVVWSDQATQMFGTISARGGAAGGNGGQVETSGHYLDMQGKVDTRAPRGANGSLLLDPSDVYIALDQGTATAYGMVSGSSGLSPSGGLFLETGAVKDSLLTTAVLQSALQTTDVTVSTANSSGTGSGTITVLSPVLWTNSHNLSLTAASDIQLKSSITGINGTLTMSSGGSIVQTTSPIDALAVSNVHALAAGDITLDNNANTIGGTAELHSSGGNVRLTAVNVHLGDSSAAGALAATAYNGDLSVNGDLSAGTSVALESSKANGRITVASGHNVSTTGGDITLVADKMSLDGTITGVTQHAVQLTPYQSSVNLLLGGSAADATGVLGLSQGELQNISVPANGLLAIGTQFGGNSATGTLTVSGALDLSGSLGGGGLLLQTRMGDLTIANGASLSAPGVISLQTLPSGDHRVTNAGSVTSTAGGINIFAGKMTLAGGTLNAASVSLETGNQIDLGATGNPADTLALTSADLNSVASGNLYVSINSVHTGTGDIVVSAPMSVMPSLSLTAQRNITMQSSLSTSNNLTLSTAGAIAPGAVSVGGAFELQSGDWVQIASSLPAFSAADFKLTGGTFTRALGGDGLHDTPLQMADVYGLQGAATLNNSTSYVLNNNIDASATANWSGSFRPLAGSGVFTGTFDGAGHTISGLTINRPGEDNVGLFSLVNTGTIRDLALSGVNIHGHGNVGGLAGNVAEGIGYINNVSVSGAVTGVSNVGAVIGNNGGLLGNAHSSGTVTGQGGGSASNIGGLAGRNTGQISDSWSDAAVSSYGDGYTGGLVGSNTKNGSAIGAVTRSYASGAVYSSGEIVGGLIGDNNGGTLTLSYATGDVNGGRNVGGLVGRNVNGSSIDNAYASGNVSGNSDNPSLTHANIGGLAGDLFAGSINNVYSSGSVSPNGFGSYQGMIGAHEGGTLTQGYFNSETAGTSGDAAGATGLTSAQMQQQGSFGGFNFSSGAVWRIYEGHTTPLLKNFLTPYQVTVSGGDSVTKEYDGASAAFTGSAGTLPSGVHGALGFDGAVNAGTYAVGGLWSTTYDISYAGTTAQLVINPRPVTVSVYASKTYDGSQYLDSGSSPSFTFGNMVGADTLDASGLVYFGDRHAGSNKPLYVSELQLIGNLFGNYTIGNVSGTGDIAPAALVVSGVSVNSRAYNGGVVATLGGTPSVSPFSGDNVSVSLVGSGTASFNNKNVGSGKLVTVNAASFSLSGAAAADYVVAAPANLSGEITPALLTINGMVAGNRVYNMDYDVASDTYGRKASVSGGTLVGVIGGEQVGLAGASATFADKNVGTAKPVTVNGVTLNGADAGNYAVVSYPAGLAADITPAALTVTLASREYNNSTAGSYSNAMLHGVLGTQLPDDVALASGSATATYADKNIGVAKPVTVGGAGLSLSGADAGNYTVTTVSGDITARPLATWTATGAGLWSDAGNWADGVAPSGANVLAAALGGSSGLVTYDASAGNTTLVKLSSGGTPLTLSGGKLTLTGANSNASAFSGALTLAGGALDLPGWLAVNSLSVSSGTLSAVGGSSQLQASSLNQSGGALSVAGSLDTSGLALSGGTLSGVGVGSSIHASNLNQTGGIIDSTGTVSLGAYGNLAAGNVRAHVLTLNAGEGGVVTQTANSQLVADELSAAAAGDITLTNANNHVGKFSASNHGNIALTNTVTSGELLLGALTAFGNIIIDNHGGIRTVGAITANNVGAGTGLVSITAHSPVTIQSTLTGTDIALAASTDIMLGTGSVLSSGHSIGLTAGSSIVLGGSLTVPAGGSISAVATTGSISTTAGTSIVSGGSPVTLSAPHGSVSIAGATFGSGTVPVISDGSAAAAAEAKAAADAAAAKAAADAVAAKAAADAAAKAAADAAAKAAADAAAKAAADAAAKAAADAAAKALTDAAEAAAKAAADAAAAKAAADAAAKAAADAAAKAAADAAAKAAADAAAKAAADLAAQSQQNQPVTAAINSTVNIINSSVNNNPASGSRQVEVPETHVVSTGGSSGNSAPDDRVPDEKNLDGSPKSSTAAKEQVKKMYCN